MSQISLRQATPDDVAGLTRLVQAAYGHYVERLGGPPRPLVDDYAEVVADRTVTVAERDGELVGLLVTGVDEADCCSSTPRLRAAPPATTRSTFIRTS